MNFRDVELLSAYLDGRLSPSVSARLETRLTSDRELRAVMDDLRSTRALFRKLPQRRAPRDFTLTPKMAGLKAPEPRAYPAFRLATALATLLFVVTFAVNGVAPLAAPSLAAAPAVGGFGGGCQNCGSAESAPQATEAPIQPFAAVIPTETPLAAQDNTRSFGTPTQEIAPKAAPLAPQNGQPARVRNEAPVPFIWQVILGILALLCGVAAWLTHFLTQRKFHRRWDNKK